MKVRQRARRATQITPWWKCEFKAVPLTPDVRAKLADGMRKRGLDSVLAQCDPSAPYTGEVWAEAQPVGREFGAPVSDAAAPLEQLRGTVQRYDNPTDPVWPLSDE